MILCIDVGNSQIAAGVFANETLLLQCRYGTKLSSTSDELGIFFRNILSVNGIDYKEIHAIGIASVVPALDYALKSACIKYLNHEPVIVNASVQTGLVINTDTPISVGADLIAGALAAKALFPQEDILIVDLGTATTACYINKAGEFLGAAIAPGVKLMMEALHINAAKLTSVNIAVPTVAIGKNTQAAMQSGVFYAQLGFIQQLIKQVKSENNLTQLKVVVTGGFSVLFDEVDGIDQIIPELVLLGIKQCVELTVIV
jgi:type III pantothenate kinase